MKHSESPSLEEQEHQVREVEGLRHFPLRFRSRYRSSALEDYLRTTKFAVSPVDCIDFAASRAVPVHLSSQESLAWLVYGRALTDAEVAASLSHRKAWIHAYQSGCTWAVFYEDDVRPNPGALEKFLESLEPLVLAEPTLINFSPAQLIPPDLDRRKATSLKKYGLTRVRSYSTNAQAYAVNTSGLAVLMNHVSDPVVRPPDFPPSITLMAHYVANRGQLVAVETSGDSTVGSRGSISPVSRGLRWCSRLTGVTYLLAPRVYGSFGNYWRYEVIQRLEHRYWASRAR